MKKLNHVKILLLISFVLSIQTDTFAGARKPLDCGEYVARGRLLLINGLFNLQIYSGTPQMREFNLVGGSLEEFMPYHKTIVDLKVKVINLVKDFNHSPNLFFQGFPVSKNGIEGIKLIKKQKCKF